MDGRTFYRKEKSDFLRQHRTRPETAEKEVRKVAKPLLDIVCITEPYCDYPVAVRLTMDDGSVQTYTLENKTDYMFQKVMDSVRHMNTGYRPPVQKKRRYRFGKSDTVR